jgi:hypothetical protein
MSVRGQAGVRGFKLDSQAVVLGCAVFFCSTGAPGESTTRLVVRLMAGRDLLASDVMTGKSDPVCFVWCCSNDVSSHPFNRPPGRFPSHRPVVLGREQEANMWVDDIIAKEAEEAKAAGEEQPRSRVQMTSVCHETCDPRWDVDLVYPLHITSLEDILEGG